MNVLKYRIVKKANDGVLVSLAKGTEPVKMGWMEFKENYSVENNIWAIPTKKCREKLDEINKHISNAVKSYTLAGKYKEDSDESVAHLADLASEVQKIIEISGYTHEYVMKLINDKINNTKNTDRKKANEIKFSGYTTAAMLADNPALKSLRKKFKKK